MIERFSGDLEYVCGCIYKTLENSNRFVTEEPGLMPGQFSEYKVLQKYKYDNGIPFAILSTRYYNRSNILDFFVMFESREMKINIK